MGKVSFAHFLCKAKHRREWAPLRVAFRFATFQLPFRAILGISDVRHQFAELRRFPVLWIIAFVAVASLGLE
jgi:hypothetical protein